jgi:hypothetical protein
MGRSMTRGWTKERGRNKMYEKRMMEVKGYKNGRLEMRKL